ncbi:MAG: GtrA family protein [Rikenellaceae bacterium]|nr:GtrA family protein [Rikenellaceae bacterium]
MDKRKIAGEFIRFGLVGGLCTVLHYAVYYVLQLLLNVNVAYTIGYLIGFVVNFYLTSHFTFRETATWKRLVGMGGAHGVNYLLHMLLLNLFLGLGVPPAWAPLPVYAVAIPANFLLVRYVFKHKTK